MNTPKLPPLPKPAWPFGGKYSEKDMQANYLKGYNDARAAIEAQGVPDHCDPSSTTYDLAAMVMSDCGHSTNNQRLLDRIAARIDKHVESLLASAPPAPQAAPIDMVLHCPACGMQHVDAPSVDHTPRWQDEEGGWHCAETRVWTNPPHRSHLCHGCGHVWRPADVPTNGVQAVKTKGKADSPLTAPQAKPQPTTLQTLHEFVRRTASLLPEAQVELRCTAAGTLLIGVRYYEGNVRHGYQRGFTESQLSEPHSDTSWWGQLEEIARQQGGDR